MRDAVLSDAFATLQAAQQPAFWHPYPAPNQLEGLDVEALRVKFAQQTGPHDDLETVIARLEVATKCNFFIHVDEIDMLLTVGHEVDPQSIAAVRRLYSAWEQVNLMMTKTRSFAFFSGRSSLVFSIGEGLYKQYGISPTDKVARHIILPNLQRVGILGCSLLYLHLNLIMYIL